jgi:hypothetical protein
MEMQSTPSLCGSPSDARLKVLLAQASRLQVSHENHKKNLDRILLVVSSLEKEEEILDLTLALLRSLIDTEVTEGVKAVEELLTEGLNAVFEDQDLKVRAEVDIQRGKVSVEFLTIQTQANGTVTEAPCIDAFGGAVSTVQSILLRVIVILKRGLRPVLFLDETLPAFDSSYVHNMGNFLRNLCNKLGVDMLLVSHNQAMLEAAEHAYRLTATGAGAVQFKPIR